MKKRLRLKSLFLLLVSCILITGVANAQQYENGAQKGVIRIKFKPELSAATKSFKTTRRGVKTGISAFDAVSAKVSAYQLERVFPYAPAHEDKHRKHGLHLWYQVKFDASLNAAEVAKSYKQLGEVSIAETIGEVQLIDGPQPSEAPVLTSEELPMNDPALNAQWHYNNDGTVVDGAIAGADINLFEAWKETTGSSDVVVAIIDGGIDVDHEDLAANMWVNEAELNGVEGVDDDGNGYPDDIYGYNFVTNSGEITDHYHGTHVAGTVGAVNNNGIGVSGVAGGDGTEGTGVKMMSCQIFTEDGGVGGFANALVYAADMGAVISQNSWGWKTHNHYDQAVLDAIDYFIAEAGNYAGSAMKGGVAIFAAGNNGVEMNAYPAYYEPCVAVSALGPDNGRAGYSNYGDWVDVAAPGGNMGIAREAGILSTSPGDKYAYLQGTSMACPHVSGVAALVVSKFKGNITAEGLKRHLLTSVHDIDPFVEDFAKGKMGNGYIDAAMALQSGDATKVPEKINDLAVTAAQDFASLTWSVPADEDDGKAVSYSIYWSKNEFDAAKVQYASSAVIKSFYSNAGDELNYLIEELDANTPYYFAIKAYDRWGNESELSEVKVVSTNSGPGIRLGEDVNIAIDVTVNNKVSDALWVYNDSIGVLNWDAHVGLVSLEPDAFSVKDVVYPNASTFAQRTSLGGNEISQVEKVMAPTTMNIDERMEISQGAQAWRIIGDNDVSVTNSSASRFYVEQDKGFNLTGLWTHLKFDPEIGPAVLEIWEGPILEEAKLITAQNIFSEANVDYSRFVDMDEQVFMKKGSYYWVVIHVPAGNLYPLGIAPEKAETGSDNCLMSFNGGQSWQPLSEVIEDDTWAWAMTLRSQFEDLGEYITLTPDNGVVNGGDSLQVAIDVVSEFLVDGQYTENIVFTSNDPVNKVMKAKINLDVDGHLPILKSEKTVNFGDVFVGNTKTLDIQIVNEGYVGYKLGSYAHSSSNENVFYTDNQTSGDNIPARDAGWVRVTFKPTGAGTFNETITITDGNNPYTFNVHGVATEPAKLTILPERDTLPGDLTIGDTIADRTFTIRNDGKYPLDYMIPKFAPGYEVEGLKRPFNKFGYSWDYVIGGTYNDSKEYGWKNISSNNILGQIKTDQVFAIEVDLGFSFPFRDRFYDKVWINYEGALVFGEDGNVGLDWASGSTLDPRYLKDRDMITAVMQRGDLNNSNAAIYYEKEDGVFRVQYKYIKYSSALPNFQIVLHANGDVEVLFQKSGTASEGAKGFLVGIIDEANEDVCFATNSEYSLNMGETSAYNSYFRFHHPGEDMVTSATNASGTLLPGQSADVTLSYNTEKVLQDSVYQKLPIISNDITSPISTFTTYANFVAGGAPEISVKRDTIDFGEVFKTAQDSIAVQVVNAGTAQETITGIRFENGHFSTSKSAPIEVGTRQSAYIPVKINTEVAAVLEDAIYITTAAGEEFKVVLKGNVLENPLISISPADGITLEMPARTIKDTVLQITNDGLGDLELAILPDSWYYPLETSSPAMDIKDFEYIYVEGDGNGWIDITETAAETNLRDQFVFDELPYKAVKLDNPIPYYGQTYDTLYIGFMGWVSFVKPKGESMWDRVNGIPLEDNVPGAIAPMGGFHVPNGTVADKKDGVYYQIDEDKVIVTWNEYIDMTAMSQNYDFQVIIYNNGRIDFNYKNFEIVKSFGFVGVESPDEKQGLLVHYGMMPTGVNRYSYTVFPVKKEIVPAQTTKDIPLRLDANALSDGTYNANIVVNNNTVDESVKLVPLNLTVIGSPELTAANIEFGDIWYTEGMEVVEGFTITNTGTKAIQLDSAQVTMNDDMKVELYYPGAPGLFGYPEGYVPIKDFIGEQIIIPGRRPILVADGSQLAPGDSWQFFVSYTPTAPGASNANVVIVDIDGNEALVWNASVNAMLPPAASISDESITLHADDYTFTDTRDFVIGNEAGNNDLEWNLEFVFNRGKVEEAAAPAQTFAVKAPVSLNSEMNDNPAPSSVKSTKSEEYNRVLEYDNNDTEVDNWLGFGASLSFTSATKFTAPSDGFSVSDVKTWFRRETVNAGVLHAEILAGGDGIATASKVAEGRLEYSKDGNDDIGEFFTITLDEVAYIYPGEDFFVVIHYPLGVSNPQGTRILQKKDDAVADRFFFEYEGDWYDLTSQGGFETFTFMVKAMERELDMKTWVTVDQMSGTAAAGEVSTLTLNFKAEYAQEIRNNATILVNTNDPNNEQFELDVNLLMNEGPDITTTVPYPTVIEAETLEVPFTITDKEGDSYNVEVSGAGDYYTYVSTAEGITISLAPGYFDQGIHDLELIATDEHGAKSSYKFQVEVVNVNRAPELTNSIATKEYYEDEELENIDLNEHFIDPDGEELRYEVSVDNQSVVNIYTSVTGIVIEPLAEGTATVKVIAIDPLGLKAETTFEVIIATVTGIEEITESSTRVYPNPTDGPLNIVLGGEIEGEVIIDVLNIIGSSQYNTKITKSKGQYETKLDITNMPSGIYMVRIRTNDGDIVRKVVKK
ncbi:S8 family serine peptidase [Marinifilum fragile]|uniref:S8 family serine peptidase n=1 Tax=Marinifilum fragile TaxID=570161 RepID=UPI002AA66DA8|nr:S8 family serine peptidase [Marinifilum fragile]